MAHQKEVQAGAYNASLSGFGDMFMVKVTKKTGARREAVYSGVFRSASEAEEALTRKVDHYSTMTEDHEDQTSG